MAWMNLGRHDWRGLVLTVLGAGVAAATYVAVTAGGIAYRIFRMQGRPGIGEVAIKVARWDRFREDMPRQVAMSLDPSLNSGVIYVPYMWLVKDDEGPVAMIQEWVEGSFLEPEDTAWIEYVLFDEYGIRHGDLHERNAIETSQGFALIDLDAVHYEEDEHPQFAGPRPRRFRPPPPPDRVLTLDQAEEMVPGCKEVIEQWGRW